MWRRRTWSKRIQSCTPRGLQRGVGATPAWNRANQHCGSSEPNRTHLVQDSNELLDIVVEDLLPAPNDHRSSLTRACLFPPREVLTNARVDVRRAEESDPFALLRRREVFGALDQSSRRRRVGEGEEVDGVEGGDVGLAVGTRSANVVECGGETASVVDQVVLLVRFARWEMRDELVEGGDEEGGLEERC